MNKRKNAFATTKRSVGRVAGLFSILMLLLGMVAGCGDDEFQQSVTPGAAMLSVNGATAVPVSFRQASFVTDQNNLTTITLVGDFNSVSGSGNAARVTLLAPANQINVAVDVSKTTPISAYVETTTSNGSVTATPFTSTAATGTVTLTYVGVNEIQGEFSVTFTGAASARRQFTNGVFVLNGFTSKP